MPPRRMHRTDKVTHHSGTSISTASALPRILRHNTGRLASISCPVHAILATAAPPSGSTTPRKTNTAANESRITRQNRPRFPPPPHSYPPLPAPVRPHPLRFPSRRFPDAFSVHAAKVTALAVAYVAAAVVSPAVLFENL